MAALTHGVNRCKDACGLPTGDAKQNEVDRDENTRATNAGRAVRYYRTREADGAPVGLTLVRQSNQLEKVVGGLGHTVVGPAQVLQMKDGLRRVLGAGDPELAKHNVATAAKELRLFAKRDDEIVENAGRRCVEGEVGLCRLIRLGEHDNHAHCLLHSHAPEVVHRIWKRRLGADEGLRELAVANVDMICVNIIRPWPTV